MSEAPRSARARALAVLGGIVAALPQPLLLMLGSALTTLAWPLLGRRRRIARRNLELCFPDLDAAARRRLLRDTLRAASVGALESLRAWFADDRRIAALYRIEGLEQLESALASGRGAILLAAHLTPIELACRMLSHAHAAPVPMLVRRHNDAALEALVDARRRAHAGETIEKKDVAGLLRALRRKQPVVYAADQDFSYQHAFVPFFGVAAATLTATSRIAARSGAAVLPFAFHRQADGRYLLRLEPPWPDYPSDDAEADAARYLAWVEAQVREHPAQYLWVHRRFKTRPPGQPSLYG